MARKTSLFLNFLSLSFARTLFNDSVKYGFQRLYCSSTHSGTHRDSTGSTIISINAITAEPSSTGPFLRDARGRCARAMRAGDARGR
ncbi:MAG: hypothetical protein ACPG7R_10165, partial [Planctomycetota bacterium]